MWKSYCETFGRKRMIQNAEKIQFYIQSRDVGQIIKVLEEAIEEVFNRM